MSIRPLVRPYFIISGDRIRQYITLDREVDLCYWQKQGATSLVFFTRPLPVSLCFDVLKKAEGITSKNVKGRARSLMASLGLLDELSYQRIALKKRKDRRLSKGHLKALLEVLTGRLLYPKEILASLRERSIVSLNLPSYLQSLLLEEKIFLSPSLSRRGRGFYCYRCGGEEVEEVSCSYCQEQDYVCVSCKIMGESSLCHPLFGQSGEGLSFPAHLSSYHLQFQLSPFQSSTAKRLKAYVTRENKKRVLFWAVCGAGKTEVTFPLMDAFLKEGRPILLALPRRDVVHQLGDRIKKAFSPLPVVVLTGSSPTRYENGILVVATTHQVIRFYRYFQLIILDEFDAFPYSMEPMLDFGVRRSLAPEGHLVYMSATPQRSFFSKIHREDWGLLQLPLRYHHKPLPEPQLYAGSITGMMKSLNLPPPLFRFFYGSLILRKVQLFVFVPTKDLTKKVKEWLSSLFKKMGLKIEIDAVHSKIPTREEKIEAFFNGCTRVMVTTTILERGVTLPKCDVLVLFSCFEAIFTPEALVQISGRTGRSMEYPKGEVLFFGERISSSMEEARRQIVDLNLYAKKRGLFRE